MTSECWPAQRSRSGSGRRSAFSTRIEAGRSSPAELGADAAVRGCRRRRSRPQARTPSCRSRSASTARRSAATWPGSTASTTGTPSTPSWSASGTSPRRSRRRRDGRRVDRDRLVGQIAEALRTTFRGVRLPIPFKPVEPEADERRLRADRRHPPRVQRALSLQGRCPPPHLRRRDGIDEVPDAARGVGDRDEAARIPGGSRPTANGPRTQSRFRRGRGTRSARAGWGSMRPRSGSTGRRTRRRSATRPPTVASACGSPTPRCSSRRSTSGRRSTSSG